MAAIAVIMVEGRAVKLAEALALRSDASKRFEQLGAGECPLPGGRDSGTSRWLTAKSAILGDTAGSVRS